MKIKLLEKKIFIDKWKGKNYGLIPVKIDGQNLKKNLDRSEEWELIDKKTFLDKRNDNQIDIEREINCIYINKKLQKCVFIKLEKSRSEKTRKWVFKYYEIIE